MNDNNDEGMSMNVQDKSAETGIKVNNILTALVLAVMLWVGTSILDIKDEVAGVRTDFAVNNIQLTQLRREFDRHLEDEKSRRSGK